MAVIIIILTVPICAFAYLKNKNIYNPCFLLTAFWTLIVFLAALRLYGLIQPSFTVYIATLLGILFFATGCFFFSNKRITIGGNRLDSLSHSFIPKRFNIVVLCMLAYELYRFVDVFSMLRRGYTLNMIRLLYFGINVDGFQIGRFESVMETYVHLPLLYTCMALLAIDTVIPKEKKKISLLFRILGYVWIGLAQVIMGGRMVIYIFAVELVIAYIMLKKTRIQLSGKKKKILIITLVCIAIAFVYWLSISRSGNKEYPFLRSLYVDFCGCMAHMTLRFESVNIEYTYGMSLLSGIFRPFMLIIKYVLGSVPDVYQATLDIGEQLQGAVMIGPNIDFNAYVLPVYYFYYDCGFVGIVFDSFVCGAVCQTFYNKFQDTKTYISSAFYMLIVFAIFTSMIRYAGNLVYFILSFVALRLMFKKREIFKTDSVRFLEIIFTKHALW